MTDNTIGAKEEPSTVAGAFSKTVGAAAPFALASFVPGGQGLAAEMGLARFGQAALPQALKFAGAQGIKEAALGNFQNKPYEAIKNVGAAGATGLLGAAGEVIAPGIAPTVAGNIAKGAGRLGVSTVGGLTPGVISRVGQGQNLEDAIIEELPAALVSAAPTVATSFSGPRRINQSSFDSGEVVVNEPRVRPKRFETGEGMMGEFAPPGYVRDPADGSLIPVDQLNNIQQSENMALPFRSAASNQTQEFPISPAQDFRTREMRVAPNAGDTNPTTRDLAGQEQLRPFGGSTLQSLPDFQAMEKLQTKPIQPIAGAPETLPQNEYSTNELTPFEQMKAEEGIVNNRRAALREFFDEQGQTGYIDDQGKPLMLAESPADTASLATRNPFPPVGEFTDARRRGVVPTRNALAMPNRLGGFGMRDTPAIRVERAADNNIDGSNAEIIMRGGKDLPYKPARTGQLGKGNTGLIPEAAPVTDPAQALEIGKTYNRKFRNNPGDLSELEAIVKANRVDPEAATGEQLNAPAPADLGAFTPRPLPSSPASVGPGFREPNIVASKKRVDAEKATGEQFNAPAPVAKPAPKAEKGTADDLPLPSPAQPVKPALSEPAPIEPVKGTFNPTKGDLNEVKPSGNVQKPPLSSEPVNKPTAIKATGEAIKAPDEQTSMATEGPKFAGKVKIASQGYTSDLVSPHTKTKVKSRFTLVDARDPVTSHDDYFNTNKIYPQALQPRVEAKRRAEAFHGEEGMIENFTPEMLGESGLASQGAPIMNGKGEIESGNGRAILLRKLYRGYPPKATQYKQWLMKNAKKFGLDPDQIAQMEQPMLVRMRETDLSPSEQLKFTRLSNEKDVQDYSPVERAMIDAEKLDLTKLKKIGETSDLTARENLSFMQDFSNKVARPADRARLMKDGKPTQEGVRRAQNALFSKAFGTDPETLRILGDVTESTDADYRNITNVLMSKSARIAMIKEGATENAPYDISADITRALNQYANLRKSNIKVDEYLKENKLFDALTPNQEQLLRLFDESERTPSLLRNAIDKYLDTAQTEVMENAQQDSMFGNLGPGKDELLGGAIAGAKAIKAERAKIAAEKKAAKEQKLFGNEAVKEPRRLIPADFAESQRAKAEIAETEAQQALKEFNAKSGGLGAGFGNLNPNQAYLLGKFATKKVEAMARRAAAEGADFLSNPTAYYAQFSQDMEKLFGEGIKPQMEALFKYAIEPLKPMQKMENKDVGPNQVGMFGDRPPQTKEMSLSEQNEILGSYNPSGRLEINKPIKPMENRDVDSFQKDLFEDKGYKTREISLQDQNKQLGSYNPSSRLEINKPPAPMQNRDADPFQRDLFEDKGSKTREMRLGEQNKQLGSYNPSSRLEINKPIKPMENRDVDPFQRDLFNDRGKETGKMSLQEKNKEMVRPDSSERLEINKPMQKMNPKDKEYQNLANVEKQKKFLFESDQIDTTDTSKIDAWRDEPIKPMDARPRKENSWLKTVSSGMKANLLSRLSSAFNDVISTGGNVAARQAIEEPVRAIADKVLSYLPHVVEMPSFNEKGEITSSFQKTKSGERTFTLQSFDDFAENLAAAYKGTKKGKDIALKRNLTESEIQDIEKHEVYSKRTGNATIDKGLGLLDSAINAVGRVRNALDEPAYQYALRNALNARARIASESSGRSVKEIKELIKTFEESPKKLSIPDYDMINEMINGAKDSKGNIKKEGAKHEALYVTFKNDTKFSEAWSTLKSAGWEGGPAKQLLAFAADQLIPFARTQANILKQGYDISVDPLVKGVKTTAKTVKQGGLTVEDRGTLAKAGGRAALGLAVGAAGYGLGKSGAALSNIEFNPFSGEEKQEKELNRAANRDAGSVKVGNRRVSGNVLGSFRPIFNLGTNIAKSEEDETGERAKKIGTGLLDSALTHPVSSGLRDLTFAAFGPRGSFRREISRRIASGVVPAAVSDISTAGKNEKKTSNAGEGSAFSLEGAENFIKGTKEAIQEKLPLVREKLPDSYTALGDVNKKPLLQAIDPFRSKEERKSKVIDEYDRAGIGFAPLQKKKEENSEDFSVRAQITGKMTKKQLEALVESSVYEEAPKKFSQLGTKLPAFNQPDRKTRAELLKDTEKESHKLNVSVPGLSYKRVVMGKLGEAKRDLEAIRKRRIAEIWTR